MKDETYMQLAVAMANETIGQTYPNPSVGCVIVNDGAIVGMGAHLCAGEHHAEVHALRMAGDKAKGGTAYVTLEPCSHYGKTPPCADALVQAGIKRVVIANTDPNPKVSGSGIQKLRAAGIEVSVGVCDKEATALNTYFYHFMRTGLPYVTLKAATTLDGKLASETGDSQWITNAHSREAVHIDRHRYHAIVVGAGTVLRDNPRLTARLANGAVSPTRVIVDRSLKTTADLHVYDTTDAPTILITTHTHQETSLQAFRARGVRVITLPMFTIAHIVRALADENIVSLYVEGGATLHSLWLQSGCFQELHLYLGPKIIGGQSAPSIADGFAIEKMNDALQLKLERVTTYENDVQLVYVKETGE
ncbi:MAG: bifunctional diaminohydroxyphosphoribosylaminopyrimidine deaminase/5-amino-6-(5-phosphoribosylamino)uracil reductase RibD [Bacilli bacterium]